MRVLKDSILQRAKAFNVPQLVDFVLSRFDNFYQRKLLAVVNQRSLKLMTRRSKAHCISRDDIFKVCGHAIYKSFRHSGGLRIPLTFFEILLVCNFTISKGIS